ncbi:MAG: hypothetical protein MHM6MM_004768 [Cercozoa sp. M6MM]
MQRNSTGQIVLGVGFEPNRATMLAVARYITDEVNLREDLLPDFTLALSERIAGKFEEAFTASLSFAQVNLSTSSNDSIPVSYPAQQERDANKPKALPLVIGFGMSSLSLDMQRVLRNFALPQLSFSATTPLLSDKSVAPTFSRCIGSDHQQAAALANVCESLGWLRVGVIYVNDIYGGALAQVFTGEAAKRGIDASHMAAVPQQIQEGDASQIRSILREIRSQRITVILLIAHREQAAAVLNEASALAMRSSPFVWMGTDSWFGDNQISAIMSDDSKNALEGTIGIAPMAPPVVSKDGKRNEVRHEFDSKFFDWANATRQLTQFDESVEELLNNSYWTYFAHDCVYLAVRSVDRFVRNYDVCARTYPSKFENHSVPLFSPPVDVDLSGIVEEPLFEAKTLSANDADTGEPTVDCSVWTSEDAKRQGRYLTQLMRTTSFVGATGAVSLDANGDRVGGWGLFNWQRVNGELTSVLVDHLDNSQRLSDARDVLQRLHWPHGFSLQNESNNLVEVYEDTWVPSYDVPHVVQVRYIGDSTFVAVAVVCVFLVANALTLLFGLFLDTLAFRRRRKQSESGGARTLSYFNCIDGSTTLLEDDDIDDTTTLGGVDDIGGHAPHQSLDHQGSEMSYDGDDYSDYHEHDMYEEDYSESSETVSTRKRGRRFHRTASRTQGRAEDSTNAVSETDYSPAIDDLDRPCVHTLRRDATQSSLSSYANPAASPQHSVRVACAHAIVVTCAAACYLGALAQGIDERFLDDRILESRPTLCRMQLWLRHLGSPLALCALVAKLIVMRLQFGSRDFAKLNRFPLLQYVISFLGIMAVVLSITLGHVLSVMPPSQQAQIEVDSRDLDFDVIMRLQLRPTCAEVLSELHSYAYAWLVVVCLIVVTGVVLSAMLMKHGSPLGDVRIDAYVVFSLAFFSVVGTLVVHFVGQTGTSPTALFAARAVTLVVYGLHLHANVLAHKWGMPLLSKEATPFRVHRQRVASVRPGRLYAGHTHVDTAAGVAQRCACACRSLRTQVVRHRRQRRRVRAELSFAQEPGPESEPKPEPQSDHFETTTGPEKPSADRVAASRADGLSVQQRGGSRHAVSFRGQRPRVASAGHGVLPATPASEAFALCLAVRLGEYAVTLALAAAAKATILSIPVASELPTVLTFVCTTVPGGLPCFRFIF